MNQLVTDFEERFSKDDVPAAFSDAQLDRLQDFISTVRLDLNVSMTESRDATPRERRAWIMESFVTSLTELGQILRDVFGDDKLAQQAEVRANTTTEYVKLMQDRDTRRADALGNPADREVQNNDTHDALD
jgi:hypothetical protein